MGVFAGVDPRPVDPEAIAAEMRSALYQWFTGHVRIYDPNRDSNGTNTLVLDSGADGALIQPLRAPSMLEYAGQPSSLLGVRFQIRHDRTVEAGQVLRGGLVLKVIDGGNATGLDRYVFALPEVIDSSLRWGSIMEAVVISNGV